MRHALSITLALLTVPLAWGCGSSRATGEATTIYEMVTAPVDSVAVTSPIVAGEAAKITVKGTFADECSSLDRFLTSVTGSIIDVTVYAKHDVAGCKAAAVPFSGDHYIDGLATGVYTVRVNADDKLTAQVAVVEGRHGGIDAGAASCSPVTLDAASHSFPDTILAGQDLVISMTVALPDTCHVLTGTEVKVEATGIVITITGEDCAAANGASACKDVALTQDVEQKVSGLTAGSYVVFINGDNAGTVRVMEPSQCASSLAPVSAVAIADPGRKREGDPIEITVSGTKPDQFSLSPFTEARKEGAVSLTLEMFSCTGGGSQDTPFTASYTLAGLAAGTWLVGVNDMASVSVSILPACVRQRAPVEWADIYSSLYDNGTGQVLKAGTPLDAVVGGTFASGCWTFDGFDYTLANFHITLNAMAVFCDGPCTDKTTDFRETYTVLGLDVGHYSITINSLKTFEFDVVQ